MNRLDPLTLAEEIEGRGFKNQIYDKMIQLKTGILFATACQLGALAAEADEPLRKISFLYGYESGRRTRWRTTSRSGAPFGAREHSSRRNGRLSAGPVAFCPGASPLRPVLFAGADPSLGAAAAEFFRAA